jgi:hypothetical protein
VPKTKGANHHTAQEFIDAIPGTGGIITDIATRVGCCWNTAKKYITDFATVRAAWLAETEAVLDSAESVIVNDIRGAKDVQTSKWFLTMKGGDRGYAPTHRQQISGPEGGPIEHREAPPDLSKLTDEELEQIIDITGKIENGSDQGEVTP